MPFAKITLDQWAALISVVESRSYASAAERLNKSQSTLSYAISQIQKFSGVQIFNIEGRKAILTEPGQALYLRAKRLLEEAQRIEQMAAELASGWETEIRLAVEIIFPSWLLLECLDAFSSERPRTNVQLYESVLGGTNEALITRQVDLAIGTSVPAGFLGEALMQVHFVPATAPDHPLHALGRPLTASDLRCHRHLVVRETGEQETHDLKMVADQRWTVSTKATSIQAAKMGLGFAWYPTEEIRAELESGKMKILPMGDGTQRYETLYLMYADPETVRPGVKRLAEIIRAGVRNKCPEQAAGISP